MTKAIFPHGCRRRRGMTLILVLMVVSIALAVSYSVVSTQGVTLQLHRNSDRQSAARAAAVAGFTAALREMHLANSWKGVDSVLTGRLNATDTFDVTFTAGDPSLTSSHPKFSEYPLRVTLLSTGYAQDPSQPAAIAKYRVRAVVRLAPKQLAAEPSGWNALDPYTVFQWKPEVDGDLSRFIVEVPSRIEGPVRIQRALQLCVADPDDDQARQRLLADLRQMQQSGQGDHRPFTGPLHMPIGDTSFETRSLLTKDLGLSLTDKPTSNEANWEHLGTVTTYRLYRGGPTYAVPTVGPELRNVVLQPDPVTNPLGIFFAPWRLHIFDNVTVRGTLITDTGEGDIFIYGDNVRLEGANLPAPLGATSPVQLPVVIVSDDVRIWTGASGSIAGLAVVSDEVEFKQGGQQETDFTLAGRTVAKEMLIQGRDEWMQTSLWWQTQLTLFRTQAQVPGGEPLFPKWLSKTRGLLFPPRIRIQPATTPTTYHWNNAADPIYVPHSADQGLRWDLVEWTEMP